MIGVLASLAGLFFTLSLIAVGGANALVAEMARQVGAYGWMDGAEFATTFALAQAAPGPNMLVVTLIGWRVAGLAGALTATLAFVLPATVFAYFVCRLWHRFAHAKWRMVVQAGITPVTVGLVMAAAVVLCRGAITGPATAALTAASAAVMVFTRWHPLWVLGVGVALGVAGVV